MKKCPIYPYRNFEIYEFTLPKFQSVPTNNFYSEFRCYRIVLYYKGLFKYTERIILYFKPPKDIPEGSRSLIVGFCYRVNIHSTI